MSRCCCEHSVGSEAMRRWVAASIALLGLAALPAPSLAQTLQENAHSCTDPQSSSDLRIKSCTALIDSGQVSRQSLAGVFNNRAAAYYSENDNAHAIADFTRAIELDPNLPGAHYNRGDAYLANKEYERAIADYDAAISANPQDAWAYHDRGLAERHLGRMAHSEADITKARSIDPSVGK